MREFYFNGDFDRTLRGAPSVLERADPTLYHEMANHFLFAPAPEDSLILHAPLPEDFLAYLAAKGIAPPRIQVHPDFTPEADFTPFGWNRHTLDLSLRYMRPHQAPDLAAVRLANSREFSQALEARSGEVAMGVAGMFTSLADLEYHRQSHPTLVGWIAKGNHGNAGTANRRLPSGPLSDDDRRALKLLFAENGKVALEPWQARILDLALNVEVDTEGRLHDPRGHITHHSRDGAFLGVQVGPSGMPPEPWGPALGDAATRLGAALKDIGYSGPVGLDAYVWNGPDGPAIRPLVDVNARLSMALPAHGLARRLPGRHILWTWTKPRKLRLPTDYRGLSKALGEADFNPDSREGILAVSPLRLDPRVRPSGGTRRGPSPASSLATHARPRRIGFALVARDEGGLDALRRAFTDALGRTGDGERA